ncbi:CCA tRNA nucleotidyltransferase [Sulfurimonas sp. SAG-AH-194-I05]|nr:CCA tRNA nucleotidyltransferase [Sulfurimonas sp. SAG-AH-194-I05]MDF1875980.1 CCA tRNA nucleotidyltransferase [Sulfurimonas sp. SAG-AH-194-I05]
MIFDKLNKCNVKIILVGGYVRDKILNIPSKDIDIELYGVQSFQELTNILSEFGSINVVGKSFGVCKLSLDGLEIDFTLPRRDNKIAQGHKGFSIKIDNSLDFTQASKRRDFTINTIGYDIKEKKLLDPFNGLYDLKNKILKAVDIHTFGEDPLRVLRAVGFASRLRFTLDSKLFLLCKEMCDTNILEELPKERMYEELKKILLKSPKPSYGFKILKDLNALKYFTPLDTLEVHNFNKILDAIDVPHKIKNKKIILFIMLSLLCSQFNNSETKLFIQSVVEEKNILANILSLINTPFKVTYNDSGLYHLASKVNIEHYLYFSQALHVDLEQKKFETIRNRAKELGIYNKKTEPLLRGEDIQKEGLKPSKEYALLLNKAYEQQMDLKIKTKDEAIRWLKNYLIT